MDKAIAQALSSLLPALNGPLPSELSDLATSLLAQSRNKASSLKAEEEIARTYACANIACERLKQTLTLPKIQPRPPCPPKVYQKLYKFLDDVLQTRARKTARSLRASGPQQTSSPAKPSTPARPAHTRPDTTPKRRSSRKATVVEAEVPLWVMPAIRRICKRLDTPAAPHHVFAGVSSILSLRDTKPQDLGVKISALVVITYSLVVTRLAGVKGPADEYQRKNDLAMEIVREVAGEDLEDGDVREEDLEKCMMEVKDQKWTQMDWFMNVPIGAGLGGAQDSDVIDAQGIDLDEEGRSLLPTVTTRTGDDHTEEPTYLQAGLGTMMQDKYDYLSDARRQDYQEWKKDILAQIEELEKADEMDVENG